MKQKKATGLARAMEIVEELIAAREAAILSSGVSQERIAALDSTLSRFLDRQTLALWESEIWRKAMQHVLLQLNIAFHRDETDPAAIIIEVPSVAKCR